MQIDSNHICPPTFDSLRSLTCFCSGVLDGSLFTCHCCLSVPILFPVHATQRPWQQLTKSKSAAWKHPFSAESEWWRASNTYSPVRQAPEAPRTILGYLQQWIHLSAVHSCLSYWLVQKQIWIHVCACALIFSVFSSWQVYLLHVNAYTPTINKISMAAILCNYNYAWRRDSMQSGICHYVADLL